MRLDRRSLWKALFGNSWCLASFMLPALALLYSTGHVGFLTRSSARAFEIGFVANDGGLTAIAEQSTRPCVRSTAGRRYLEALDSAHPPRRSGDTYSFHFDMLAAEACPVPFTIWSRPKEAVAEIPL